MKNLIRENATDIGFIRLMTSLALVLSLSGCLEGSDGKNGVNGSAGNDGRDASPVLLNTSSEPAGANCPSGGHKVASGLDLNFNGLLDTAEVQTTSYVCHGSDGNDGADGSDGLSALIKTGIESAGSNCPAGGYKVQTGLDTDADGVLDNAEVQATSYICNGERGADGLLTLIKVQSEPTGPNCAEGGQRIDSGLDANADRVLEAAEIQSTVHVCNGLNGANGSDGSDGSDGADGSDGLSALVEVIEEVAGENCLAGGYRVDSGQDVNANAILDAEEVLSSSYICHGLSYMPEAIGGINDTGMTFCGDYADSFYGGVSDVHQNNLPCETTGATATTGGVDSDGDPVPAGQDAHFGRDAQALDGSLIKIGSGSAGFDFTKLERNGNPLSSSASSWSCVRDNVTGLVWEVKTADGGLRDAAHTYSWFNGSGANDGGFPGTENGGICAGGTGCDIEKFVHDVNSDTLCGIDNWRVPTPSELVGIASFDRKNPAIDTDYFPNTAGVSYWTSASYADYAYGVVFGPGFIGDGNKSSALSARLVGAPL
jgi:hypothetical protein